MAKILVQSRDPGALDALVRRRVFPIEVLVAQSSSQVASLGLQAETIAVILDVADLDGRSLVDTVGLLRRKRSDLAIVVWCERDQLAVDAVPDLAEAGVSALVFRDIGPLQDHVLASIVLTMEPSFDVLVGRALQRRVPPDLIPLVHYCVGFREAKRTVSQVARAFGMPSRSLASRLQREALPTTHVLLAWGRLMSACWVLGHTKESVERVALRFGFPSAGRFRVLLRELAHTSPDKLRNREEFGWVLRCFDRAFNTGVRKP
jgi:AraC-like DNA-binding protein